jgi:DNA-directed RNA polymerase subunit P
MYRCAKCGEPIRNDTSGQTQCDKCGSWIFIKERPNEKKTLKSD